LANTNKFKVDLSLVKTLNICRHIEFNMRERFLSLISFSLSLFIQVTDITSQMQMSWFDACK